MPNVGRRIRPLACGLGVLILTACVSAQRAADARVADNGAALWLSNLWALKVISVPLGRDSFAEDQPITVVIATQNETPETLFARFLALSHYGTMTKAESADFTTLRTTWLSGYGKRLDVKFAIHAAMRETGTFSDIILTGLSAKRKLLELDSQVIAHLGKNASEDLSPPMISPDLARDLVKLEVLLNRALTPKLAKEIAVTEADLWRNAGEDARRAVERTGQSLPGSLGTNKRAAAFVAAARTTFKAATSDELRESRKKIRATFQEILAQNADLAHAMPIARTTR
jgi:hypothetical protein